VAQPPPAKSWLSDDADFTHMPRPPMALALEHCGAHDTTVDDGNYYRLAVGIDSIEPRFDLFAVEQVFF
jgi:hypothetical protein